MMGKAESAVTKELDIVKFIRRQRFTQYASLALLNGRQLFVTDGLSNMLIRESSDLDEETEDDMELAQENFADVQQMGTKIQHSLDPVDKRLVNIYRLGRDDKDQRQEKDNKVQGSAQQEEGKEEVLDLQLIEKDEQDTRRKLYLDVGGLGGLPQAAEDQSAMLGEHPDGSHHFLLQNNVPDKQI